MRKSLVVGTMLAALLAGAVAAQTTSNTLPKGWDTKEGIVVGTVSNSQFWVGFDLGRGALTE